ncbi:MAG: hypothetical protein Q9227_006779 [Pyrenula ochraceoflavens]
MYTFSNGNVFSGNAHPEYGQQTGTMNQNAAMQYLPATMMPGFMNGTTISPGTMTAYWPSYLPADAPGLDPNRRSSWSSVEENGPPTPAGVAAAGTQDFWTPAMVDRSGTVMGMPSYYSAMPSLSNVYTPGAIQVWRNPENNEYEARNFDTWTSQAPAIPRAVPALWTNNDNMTLAKCLQNVEGITNVYIRGFLPETNDEMLRGYAARFGEIDSCKAIIDMDANPPKCKGSAFSLHGTVSGRLTGFLDMVLLNTFTPPTPKTAFVGFTISVIKRVMLSFESREMAEKVLADFHMMPGKDSVRLSLRFADTKAQKELKAQSNKCRQHRKNEYEFGVEHYDSASPSPVATRFNQGFTHVSPASQLSFHSPAGMSNNFTPATNMEDVTKSMKGVSVNHSWPARGGLASVTNTPSYRSSLKPAARNAFDLMPNAPVPKELAIPSVNAKTETPSPKKVTVKTEISTEDKSPIPLRQENLLTTPGSVH